MEEMISYIFYVVNNLMYPNEYDNKELMEYLRSQISDVDITSDSDHSFYVGYDKRILLSEDFDLLLGDSFVLMPNVTKYAVSNNITIVFTSVVPETEIDAIFVCKSIGENTYECISIDRLENYNVKSIISYISAIMIAFLALVESFLLVIGFHNFDNTNINYVLLGIFGGIGLVFLGGVAIKLFKNVEGITKYIFIIFGCFMIFIGIAKLFIMFQ